MEVDQAIKGRSSVRAYRDEVVPESVIKELLDLARHAPSSMNGQPWHFVVVRQPAIKRALARIKNKYCPAEKRTYKADFLQGASVVVVVCVDRKMSHDREVENAVLAAATFMLVAYARGLGTVYMSAYRIDEPGLSREISRLLRLPKSVSPYSILPLGYPAACGHPKGFRDLKEMTHFEHF